NDNYKISKDREIFSAKQWDKTAAPEDVFIWQSDDPTSSDYGIVIGYTANVENYTVLRYPSRCTEVQFSENLNYNGITTSASRAFTNNILKVELPETVTKIGKTAFGDWKTLSFGKMTEIKMSSNVTVIDLSAFCNCSSLTSINIPENVTVIDLSAFDNCSSLTSVKIPENVTRIRQLAFYGCTSLTNIELPNAVSYIESWVFEKCTSLSSVTYKGKTYTSKSSLIAELRAQGVSLYDNAFEDTALQD
ncbi:MAG: leucine-rich repeat protein, partial [Clostridia bacterium]|nr:leucine-rich repeat protein [Clostridia bacterium]